MTMELISVQQLCKSFPGVRALHTSASNWTPAKFMP